MASDSNVCEHGNPLTSACAECENGARVIVAELPDGIAWIMVSLRPDVKLEQAVERGAVFVGLANA